MPTAAEPLPRQPDAELTVRSRRPPNPGVAAARDEKNAALALAADELRKRQAQPAIPDLDAPPPPREDVESVEVELLDGRKVYFGPPPGVSLTMRIAITFPGAASELDRLARICMSIRSVDGQPMRAITNIVELTAVANAIGDAGIDELNFWFDRHWGVLRISDLQLLKKNLRGG